MNDSVRVQICVLGAGPAGCSVAQRLAELGHDVCLIEQSAFPRPHIGESLTPAILLLLDQLELREQVEKAGFLRPHQAIIHWAGETRLKTYEGEPGLQVDRGIFDQLLLESAQEAGVRVRQPIRITKVTQNGSDGWQLSLNGEDGPETLHCDYLIDAGGQSSPVAGKRTRLGAATLALYGYWQNSAMHGTESRVEAGENTWFWSAPLPGGLVNACVFVDSRHPSRHSALHPTGSRRDQLEVFYREQLGRSNLLRDCLSGHMIRPITACSASASYSDMPVGEGFIRVGDACVTLDPISSQGVQSAISMALQAAVVVHTQIRFPTLSDLAAEFYRQRQRENITRHQRWANRFYAEQAAETPTEFWQTRAAGHAVDSTLEIEFLPETSPIPPECKLMLHPAVSFTELPILKGDLITSAQALSHPSLERPIAFIEHVELVPLMRLFVPGDTPEILIEKWSHQLPAQHSTRILNWLWQHHLIQKARS
ncbi:flavin-dependent monooxygenase QhpG [Nitrincola sp. MINF-07-Sa-05]|uniref:flavin-dependent monooxygenase QhpG n=1 Tax=Nitrincola salilacus TaxID=3400273 RepID=UPI003917E8A7